MMKTRKTVVVVLMATLLVLAALIAGCMSPALEETSNKDAENSYQPPPEGKGIVRLKIIDDSNARTILPLPDITNRTFDVVFTSSTGTTANNVNLTGRTYAQLTGGGFSQSLDPDSYNVSVTAYDSSSNAIAGWSRATPLAVSAGASVTVSAVLVPYTSGGTGTFAFNITPSSTVGAVTSFDIFSYADDDSVSGYPKTLAAASNSTETLPSGYYLVKVRASLTNYQTMEYIHALHIYQHMTSTMDALTVPALVKNVFTITYDLDGGDDTGGNFSDSTPSTEIVKYGNFTTGKGGSLAPVGTSDTFEGWYTAANGGGTKWTLGNGAGATRVTGDTTLYANWIAAGSPGNATFAITFPIDEQALVTGDTTISRAAIYGGGTLALTLTAPPAPASWTDIEWRLSGTPITGTPLTDGGRTLTINNSVTFWELLAGPITVNVSGKIGGVPYSKNTIITVGP
jgi:hypothetical protein